MSKKLQTALLNLGKVPSFVFLLVYIILIVAFALYYKNLPPKSFYHSTSKFEYQNLGLDANSILKEITTEIINNYKKYRKKNSKADNWQVDIDSLRAHSLNVLNFPEEVSFQIFVPVKYEVNGRFIESVMVPEVIVPLQEKLISDDIVYPLIKFTKMSYPKIDGVPEMPAPDTIFNFKSDIFQSISAQFPISIKLYNKIISFGEAYRGFPSNSSGQFSRMLYFSSGIATSNTFGDIVPLTSHARKAVTIESILMIFIIGLFLNSLVNDFAKMMKRN